MNREPLSMNIAHDLVEQAVGDQRHHNVPPRIREIVDRHYQTLLGLANALIAAGRDEDEVVQIIQKASESFSIKLRSETESLSS